MFGKMFEMYPDNTKYNWEYLKKMGKVTEEKTFDKETGLTTITRTFESTGGLMTVTSTESYYETDKKEEEYYELKSKLDEAVKNQEYELAIKLRDQITEIKKSFLNKNKTNEN